MSVPPHRPRTGTPSTPASPPTTRSATSRCAPPRRLAAALLATAFEAYEAHDRRQQDRLFASAERGRPEVGHETWHQADVRAGGEAYRLRVSRCRQRRYHVDLDGRSVEIDVERSGRFELRLRVGGET